MDVTVATIFIVAFVLCLLAIFIKARRDAERDPIHGKPVVRSTGSFLGWHTIYDLAGDGSPYMTRIWVGRLRLHIFYRGDLDEDCHDHPWDFWTFPLTSYVEEVAKQDGFTYNSPRGFDPDGPAMKPYYEKHLQIVPALRLTFRPAIHCHRVLGAWNGRFRHPYWGDQARMSLEKAKQHGWLPAVEYRKPIVTLVWRGASERSWGFLKNRDGKWCWVAWRDYVFNGGKQGPCQ